MSEMSQERKDAGSPQGLTRRHLIKKTLTLTAGAYGAMTVVEQVVGPRLDEGGMPAHAISSVGEVETSRLLAPQNNRGGSPPSRFPAQSRRNSVSRNPVSRNPASGG